MTRFNAARYALFGCAVIALYVGGFIYDELGPLVYAVGIMMLASLPLLLKINFWKQILFGLPLLIIRVLAKFALRLFGKHTFYFVADRFEPVANRYIAIKNYIESLKHNAIDRWQGTSRYSRAYLIITFAPLAIAVAFILIVMELLRLRLLRMGIEKLFEKLLSLIPNKLFRRSNKSPK